MIEKITEKNFDAVFDKVGKECPESLKKSLVQFIKFGIVGVSDTVISYLLYLGTLILLKRLSILPEMDYLVAQAVTLSLSAQWFFYWNDKKVFKLDENCREFSKALQYLVKNDITPDENNTLFRLASRVSNGHFR